MLWDITQWELMETNIYTIDLHKHSRIKLYFNRLYCHQRLLSEQQILHYHTPHLVLYGRGFKIWEIFSVCPLNHKPVFQRRVVVVVLFQCAYLLIHVFPVCGLESKSSNVHGPRPGMSTTFSSLQLATKFAFLKFIDQMSRRWCHQKELGLASRII